MTIYELTEDYLQVYEMAEDPGTDPQTIADTLEAIAGEIEIKAEGYAAVITQLNADAGALASEIERLTARKAAIENNVKRMKSSLQAAMMATGKEKFKSGLFSFSIQNNPPAVVIDDPEGIPETFLIAQEPKINKTAIKERLKAGELFKFAHLETGRSLRIR